MKELTLVCRPLLSFICLQYTSLRWSSLVTSDNANYFDASWFPQALLVSDDA